MTVPAHPRSTCSTVLLTTLAIGAWAHADWSSDPMQNLAVADRTGEQVQVKMVATADGGAYVGWFDNSGGGYDVYLQRLDAAGAEQWTHNGVLIADRSFSSTQDWDLDVDTAGHALLAFRDDRSGSPQITAARVSPAGALDWGASGIQITAGGAFVAAPKIAGTTDGNSVVAWTNDDDTMLRKLDTTGAAVWAGDLTIAPAGSEFSASDLDASDAGGVIISMIKGFFGATLHAQKVSTAGAPLWGASPVEIFDGGTLQIANFPQFVPDGSGGAVFGWYGTGPLQCYVQHVNAAGVEQFPHDGVVASTDATRNRVGPSVDYRAATGEIFLAWVETNGAQFQHGVYAQKFDAAGARQWTDTGKVIEPVGTTERTQVRTVQFGDGAVVAWVDTISFGDQRIKAARLDTAGSFVWPSFTDVSAVASSKSRLATLLSTGNVIFAAWTDGRTDAGDVYAQNINGDGSLGVTNCAADITGPKGAGVGDGNVDSLDFLLLIAQWGSPCVGSCEADITGPGAAPDGNVDSLDYLLMIAQWGSPGNCPAP